MSWKRRGRGSWVAFFAACALVIQSLLGVFATGATAAPILLDAFGNIICTSHGAEQLPAGDGTSDHHKMPDCCNVGCSMFAPVLAPRYAIEGAFVWKNREIAVFFQTKPHIPSPRREGSPGNPRAPPALT